MPKTNTAHPPFVDAPFTPEMANWLAEQGVDLPAPAEARPAPPVPTLPAGDETPPAAADDAQYTERFLTNHHRVPRATAMIHVSEKVHGVVVLLTKLHEGGDRLSIPELVENIIAEHLREHAPTLERLKQAYTRRQLSLF